MQPYEKLWNLIGCCVVPDPLAFHDFMEANPDFMKSLDEQDYHYLSSAFNAIMGGQIPITILTPDEEKRMKLRVGELYKFCSAMAIPQFLDNPYIDVLSNNRKAIVFTALTQIGRVSAKNTGEKDMTLAAGKDPNYRPNFTARHGWRMLHRYMAAAHGDRPIDPEDAMEHPDSLAPESNTPVYNMTLKHGAHDYSLKNAEEWCGLFAFWAIKRSGAKNLRPWTGLQKDWVSNRIDEFVPVPLPRPGDIGNRQAGNHFVIVVSVDPLNPDKIWTVEGNSMNWPDFQCASGVWPHGPTENSKRPDDMRYVFYSLIGID